MANAPLPETNIDLLVFPHLDLHAVIGGPTLKLDVRRRSFRDPAQKQYDLNPALSISSFGFFAPHNQAGQRLNGLPKVDPDGTVNLTGAAPGVYLFQVTVTAAGSNRIGSIVGRLQVHTAIVDWWFGNDSITTAQDTAFAHAQPSIYAKFKDDGSGADLVGDITGHNYVSLSSNDPKVVVAPLGRLRGTVETTSPVTVTGSLSVKPGTVVTNTLPVRVVNYAKVRQDLHGSHIRDVAHHATKSNMLFLAEGFADTAVDRNLFDLIVTRTTAEMFDKPRHEPYRLLGNSYSGFKAFAVSQQELATCGFRVTDNDVGFGVSGKPIPNPGPIRNAVAGHYSVLQLVELVGLPKQGENRAPGALRDFWTAQHLPGFEAGRTDDNLINAWKSHRSAGFLQASDTLFGTYLGSRWADGSRVQTVGTPAADVPARDDHADPTEGPKLAAFIDRLYDFYKLRASRELTLDPRRHPPELYAHSGITNPGNSVLSYVAGLQHFLPPNEPVGQNWIPDDSRATRSRGLIALVTYEPLIGGTAINNGTMTVSSLANFGNVGFITPVPNRPELMRREPPKPPTGRTDAGIVNFDHFVNKIAHEFGHTYNLGDEYEDFAASSDPGAGTEDATSLAELEFDNLSRIGFLQVNRPPDRKIDPDKVKWLTLPRMSVSSTLLTNALPRSQAPSQITITVDPDEIDKWIAVWKKGTGVSLRNLVVTPTKRQLPLVNNPSEFLTDLTIISEPSRLDGTIVLSCPPFSPELPPLFVAGSVAFVPLKDTNGTPLLAVEEKVAAFLRDVNNPKGRLPLNQNRNLAAATSDAQVPIPIPGFTAPDRNTFRLVGIYEGGNHWSRGFYRPTGACKMRAQDDKDDERGQFCFVCKWLITNFVDPGQHSKLHAQFYPR